jgi:heme exporter protein C
MDSTFDSTPIQTTPRQFDNTRVLYGLTALTIIAVVIGLFLALVFAGQDAEQGDVQRIFYIHMPSFIGAFLAFSATVIGGIQYLRTRSPKWDALALAGVEVGLALALINLATGSIWARPIWNTWWTWDPRLTSAAIMVLTYAAYLMLRAGIENVEQRRRFAAVYGIVAIISAIITLIIIRIRPDTIHPAVIGESAQSSEGGFRMSPNMTVALIANLLIWGSLLPLTLMWWRMRLQGMINRVEALKSGLIEEKPKHAEMVEKRKNADI